MKFTRSFLDALKYEFQGLKEDVTEQKFNHERAV